MSLVELLDSLVKQRALELDKLVRCKQSIDGFQATYFTNFLAFWEILFLNRAGASAKN